MRNRMLSATIIVAIIFELGFGFQFALSGEKTNDDPTMVYVRERKQDILVAVDMPARQEVGLPINAVVTISNEGKNSLSYGYSTALRGLGIVIVNSQGEQVPLTRWGRLNMPDKDGVTYRYLQRELGPGEKLCRKVNLARYFDLSLPGEYEMEVTWNAESTEMTECPRLTLKRVKFVIGDDAEVQNDK